MHSAVADKDTQKPTTSLPTIWKTEVHFYLLNKIQNDFMSMKMYMYGLERHYTDIEKSTPRKTMVTGFFLLVPTGPQAWLAMGTTDPVLHALATQTSSPNLGYIPNLYFIFLRLMRSPAGRNCVACLRNILIHNCLEGIPSQAFIGPHMLFPSRHYLWIHHYMFFISLQDNPSAPPDLHSKCSLMGRSYWSRRTSVST